MTPRTVVIGGGRGLMQVIPGLLAMSEHVTAIVATSDDSGSTGRLRRDLELPAVGDIRRCLLASGQAAGNNALHPLVEHRFPGTDIEGHCLGNLILAAIADRHPDTGPLSETVRAAYPIFGVDPARAAVVPATNQVVDLTATTGTGEHVHGQYAISKTEGLHQLALRPEGAAACAEALEALEALDAADLIVLGPGSLFTSIIAAALPTGLRETIQASSARTVFLPCLLPEEGEGGAGELTHQLAALARHGLHPDLVLASRTHHRQPTHDGDTPIRYADLADAASDEHSPDLVRAALADIGLDREQVRA